MTNDKLLVLDRILPAEFGCTAKLGARVYYNGYMTGSMRLTLTYVNESYYLKDEWVDHCASIRPKKAATAEGS